MTADALLDAWLDLVLGSECAACTRPGRVLCRACSAALPRGGAVAWPTPAPPGLALPVAAGAYDGALRALVNAHKEHRRLALARPLGALLGGAVDALLAELGAGPADPAVLVPVPSAPGTVRRRGHDPLLRVTRRAAALLRARGRPATVARRLVLVGRPADQAGLGAEARAANLAGTMRARAGAAGATGATGATGAPVVLVDDVLTTGATLREAQRALEAAGVAVAGLATVAATRRRGFS